VLTGGRRKVLGRSAGGYYLEPTILFGQNNMRVFQEEIFGPVLAVTTFKTMEEALEIANDTQYGLGAGVWSRNGNLAYKMGRAFRPGACGLTATTLIRHMRRLGVTSSRVLGVKPIR
jgi:aldehyde dehydrogenase